MSDNVESYSSGFKRAYNECKNQNVGTDYEIYHDGFTFIFKRNVINNVVNNKLTEDEQLVFNLLKKNCKLTSKVLSESINKSERTVQRILKSLKDKKIIERIGDTKGYWKVNGKD